MALPPPSPLESYFLYEQPRFSGALAQNLADATDEDMNNFALTDQQMKELIEDLDHQIAGVNPASESALEVLRVVLSWRLELVEVNEIQCLKNTRTHRSC